jgi:hypothetical protein
VVVVTVVTEERGFVWKGPQPLRRAAARRENGRERKDDRSKRGTPECCKWCKGNNLRGMGAYDFGVRIDGERGLGRCRFGMGTRRAELPELGDLQGGFE